MSISQAGVYSLKLYENKDFEFDYDSNGLILLSSISNTGDTLELETNDNFIKYANALVPAENNTTLNDHTLAFEINGLNQSNLDIIEKLQSSIYGWIALITFMDNQVYLINIPFHPKYDKFDSQVTHTFFVELKPRIFTLEKLEEVTTVEGVKGLLDWDGIDDKAQLTSLPNINQDQKITFYMYLKAETGFDVTQAGNVITGFYDKINTAGLIIGLKGSDFYATTQTAVNQHVSSLSGISGNEIFVEIIKSKVGGFWRVDSVKFNDVIQVSTGNNSFAPAADVFNIGSLNSSNYLKNCLLWNITLFDNVGVEINHWQGQPDGNIDSAWIDDKSANNIVISGSPTTTDLP